MAIEVNTKRIRKFDQNQSDEKWQCLKKVAYCIERESIKHNRQILSGNFLIFIPVIELDTSLRVGVGLALSEGRVLEAVSLHPVELIVDIADQTGVVLVK